MATATTNERRTVVRGLGEIALRVNNLGAMQKFYEEVMCLPLMTRFPNVAFYKIADATADTSKFSPSSTAQGVPVIAGRMQQLPLSTTSRSRLLSLISQTKKRDWRRWDSMSKPPNTHGCIGARFM